MTVTSVQHLPVSRAGFSCIDPAGVARQHGDVWRERAGRSAGGGCVRRVSACVAGRLLRPVPARVERCPRAVPDSDNHPCRMETFFSCCPVYDCPSKLASLISPPSVGQDPRGRAVSSFFTKVLEPQLFEAEPLQLPVAQPQLNATAIRQLLEWLSSRSEPPSPAERAVRTELRHILTVLETLLQLLIGELDAGRLQRPLAIGQLLRAALEVSDSAPAGLTVTTADATTLTTVLVRLQLDSRQTPLEELLRYIALYGGLDTETESDSDPEPDSRTVTQKACPEEHEDLVWAEMERPVDGRCVRHVRACRNGRVVSSPELQHREHVCDATGPELCRMFSFFTCCPVFDCKEKLRELREQDPRFLSIGAMTPEQFEQRVGPAALGSVFSPVPIVGRSLHIQTLIDMRALLGNNTQQERQLGRELDQIVGLFRSDGPAPEPAVTDSLRRLVAVLDDIGLEVTLRGAAVRPATALDMLFAGQRLLELRDALESGALPESAVPAELPGAVARLLLSLSSAERAVPLRDELHHLVLSVAGGGSAAGPELTTLVTELARLLDAWLDLLPESAFAPLPALDLLGSDSLTGLLWWLLTGEDSTRPAPLLPTTTSDSPYDGPLLEALLRLIRQSGAPTGRLRPALIRLVRQLTRPGGADSPRTVELLVEVVDQLAAGPVGLEPAVLQAVVDLLGDLDGYRQPAAAPHVLQLLVRLVEGLTPRHRVIGDETRVMLVELLRLLGGRPDTLADTDLQLLMAAVRELGEVSRRDVRPDILTHLVTLLGRVGGSLAPTDSDTISVLVELVGRLGESHPDSENAALLRLLLQMFETLAAAPGTTAPESIQLVIQLVEHLGRPGADTDDTDVMQLLLELISGLQRPPPQVGQQLVQLVLQLAQRHGPAAPPLRRLLLAVLPLLTEQTPRSSHGLLEVLMTIVEDVEGRTSRGGDGELYRLLLQLTNQLNAQRRPLPADARKLLVELFLGTQTGGASETDIMSLVLAMLELVNRPADTATATVGFNISTVHVDRPDPDIRDLTELIELLFSQGMLGGRSASAEDMTSVFTVLLGGGGSDSSDSDELLRLLVSLLETEMSAPRGGGGLNVTAILTETEQEEDYTEILQMLEMLLARFSSHQQPSGFVNITGVLVGEERNDLREIQEIIEMLLARMSMNKPRESGYVNITLFNEPPPQTNEIQNLLEMLLLEIESMERNRSPGGILNISTVVVEENRRDYSEIQGLIALLMEQLTARAARPRSPGLINISVVQQEQDEPYNMRYLLELLMAQLRKETTHSTPGFLNISGVLVQPGGDDFGDIEGLLELLLAQLSASQTPDFPGFFNISGILVNGEHTDMESLRAMLEMVMSRMSVGNDLPSEEVSAFRELIMRFFNRPSGKQDIDVQGIINMLIDLGEYDRRPTFSVAEFITLLESLDVPADHPTYTDDIQRLIVLLQEGDRSPSYLFDLTETVERLLRLVETAGGSADVSPEMLIQFILRESTRPTGGDPDGLLAALVGLLESSATPRRPGFTIDLVIEPPDSLPTTLRDLVAELQVAARRPRPLLQSLPALLELLTTLTTPEHHGASDTLRFAAQLAAAVLERAPDAADRVLVPQILLQLRQLTRHPRPDRLTAVTGLLRRLLLLEEQRRPAHSGGDFSVTVNMGGGNDSSSTDVMDLLRGLLDGRAAGGGGSSLPELTQTLLDVLLRAKQGDGAAQLDELLPQLVAVLRLVVQPPTDADRLPDDTIIYVTELARAVLEQFEPRADPLLPHVLLLLRRLGPRPQPEALRGVLVVLEQLLARQQVGVTVPDDLLELLARLEEVSERGRPTDYLPLVVTLLRRADRSDPALTTYLAELVRVLLRRDHHHLDPQVTPLILTFISGGEDTPTDISQLLSVLEMVVTTETGGSNEIGLGGSLSDLFGLLTTGGRSSDTTIDFSSWLMDLMGSDQPQNGSAVSQSLLSHLVRLLRRPGVRFVSKEEAGRLLLLLTGRLNEPRAVSVSTLDSVLSLLDPAHTLRPTDSAAGLFRTLRRRVWGPLGRPGYTDPAAIYRDLLGALTGRTADLFASEPALRQALLLLLAGPSSAQPTEETAEAAQLLLTLLAEPSGGPELVPLSVLRVLTSLLEAAAAGSRTDDVPESVLRQLVLLLTEPDRRGLPEAADELVQLLVTAVTGSADPDRHGARQVAFRLLLRVLGDSDTHRMIPIPEDSLRVLLTLPDGRNAGTDTDIDSTLSVLTSLLSDSSHGVSGLSDVMETLFGSHGDHTDDDGGQHGGLYRLLTSLMTGGSEPSDRPRPLYQWLLSQLGEDDFDPDRVPAEVYAELTELLSADRFDAAAAAGQTRRLLAALGGDQLPAERLFHRLLLLLARRGGLPAGAVSPPGRLLRRCRLLCDAAGGGPLSAGGADIQLLPGRTPIAFIGENHVIVLNG
ncbi:uncharacterized protein LOC122382180 [Amphibalanus amphitrite]|uniref:uncharacterized protein LOC122382180 n=1 Tax=Amphibalanus amphitrite TaxID=1232801 RepID=UPI001C90FCFD|nr:uncharacterized protein LOC122382180 [Amphibalanus amphitrite]